MAVRAAPACPLRLLRQLIEILLDSPAGAPDRFAVVLRELHEYSSRHGTLSTSLGSDRAITAAGRGMAGPVAARTGGPRRRCMTR